MLTIHEALFRGRESFVYRITIGELPFVTSIFPLGGRVGGPVKIEMSGWKLGEGHPGAASEKKPGLVHTSSPPPTESSFPTTCPFALDTLPERTATGTQRRDLCNAQKVQLPIIVNGRADRPGDWDVFEVAGKAGETIVAEVYARRLGSPLDSFLKVTGADGKIIALNDDHYDAASGLNTDHADSYLMVKLPADGKYFIHLGDTTATGRKGVCLPAPDQPAATRFRAAVDPFPNLYPQQGVRCSDRLRHTQGRIRRADQAELQRLAAGARIARRHAGGQTRGGGADGENQPYGDGKAGQPHRRGHGENRGPGSRP